MIHIAIAAAQTDVGAREVANIDQFEAVLRELDVDDQDRDASTDMVKRMAAHRPKRDAGSPESE